MELIANIYQRYGDFFDIIMICAKLKVTRIEQHCYIGITVKDAIFFGTHAFEVRSRDILLAVYSIFKYQCENVVQGAAESPEGDGPTHQPDFPLPAKSLTRASLVVRECESAD